MTGEAYFFDSYALVELLEANPSYETYKTKNITCSRLNLFETYYAILKKVGQEAADGFLNRFDGTIADIGNDVIRSAALFRWKYRERRISMTDAIGFTIAAKLGMPFLTGDRQFEDLPNVEFVR